MELLIPIVGIGYKLTSTAIIFESVAKLFLDRRLSFLIIIMRVLSLSLLVLCVVLAVEARLPRKPSIHSSVKFVDPADAKDNQKISLIASDSSAAPIPWQGPSSVIGGALAHLMLGTMYCWGNFLSYSPQNLKFFDGLAHPGNQPDAIYVIPLTIISQSFSMPFGPLLTKTVGPAKATLIGCLISATAVYLASFQSSLALFMLTYSVMFGIGTGLAYTAPMSAGWKWMPNLKGLVSGGILAGFGTGGFIFSLIGSKIANPEALDMVDGKFPDEVYKRFPKMLRTLSMMYAAVATVGSFLVQEKPEEPAKGEKTLLSSDGATVTESTSSKQFWLMWMMMIASGTAGLNTAAVYKQFAISSPMLTGDTYQALVGGIGAMFNGVGRLFWGTFSDIVGFKKAFTLLTILQAALCLSYKLSTNSKVQK